MKTINVMLDDGAFMPERAYSMDAGMDIKTPVDFAVEPHDSAFVDSGVHVEIPKGYVGILKSKSGLNVKSGINCTGTIDAGFSGSIGVKLYNHSNSRKEFKRGDKITQLVIFPIETPDINLVDKFADSERGDGKFGSTGR